MALVAIMLLAAALRFGSLGSAPHFGDMDWYFAAARQTLASGQLPLLGITASITWLHQGPLWTYLLLLPQAFSLPPQAFTVSSGIAVVALVYFAIGWPAALVYAVLPFAVRNDLTAYHTSLIPLFFFITYLTLLRRRPFLSGLFIGWLYQSHLLTFIYWPLWLWVAGKNKLSIKHLVLGFVVGILPFIIAGPVQLLGIFAWLTKELLTGFSGVSSGLSTAYWVVLLPGLILTLAWMLKWLSAYRDSFGQKRGA